MRIGGIAISAAVLAVVSLTSFACSWSRYDAQACSAVDPKGFAIPAFKPARPLQAGVCTPDTVDRFIDDCLGGDMDKCRAAREGTVYVACYGCLYSEEKDDVWGPFVDHGSGYEIYYGGCVAAVDSASGGEDACGAAIDAYYWCEVAACEACTAGGSALSGCFEGADRTPSCEPRATAAHGCASSSPGVRACYGSGEGREDAFRRVARVWCGAGPAPPQEDAGGAP